MIALSRPVAAEVSAIVGTSEIATVMRFVLDEVSATVEVSEIAALKAPELNEVSAIVEASAIVTPKAPVVLCASVADKLSTAELAAPAVLPVEVSVADADSAIAALNNPVAIEMSAIVPASAIDLDTAFAPIDVSVPESVSAAVLTNCAVAIEASLAARTSEPALTMMATPTPTSEIELIASANVAAISAPPVDVSLIVLDSAILDANCAEAP
jgi:hypothetical protein